MNKPIHKYVDRMGLHELVSSAMAVVDRYDRTESTKLDEMRRLRLAVSDGVDVLETLTTTDKDRRSICRAEDDKGWDEENAPGGRV